MCSKLVSHVKQKIRELTGTGGPGPAWDPSKELDAWELLIWEIEGGHKSNKLVPLPVKQTACMPKPNVAQPAQPPTGEDADQSNESIIPSVPSGLHRRRPNMAAMLDTSTESDSEGVFMMIDLDWLVKGSMVVTLFDCDLYKSF